MKRILLFLSLASVCLAQREQFLGFAPNATAPSVSTLQLNAAGTWLAIGFVAKRPGTVHLSNVWIFATAKTGTLATTDLTCDLYSDANGIPNASIESRATVTPAAAASTWLEFTGFTSTSALVQNTQYWLVFKNVNGTPASNNITYGFGGAGSANGNMAAYWGSQKVGTTDSGTTWATSPILNIVGYRLDFDDGTFQGQAISAVATDATKVNGTTKLGFYTVTPANATLNVSGMSLMFRKVGAPAGNAVLELFNNTAQIATCSIPLTDVNTTASRFYSCYWTPIQVAGGTTLRGSVSISAAGGDASNYIQFSLSEYTTETSAGSLAQLPFGNWQRTVYNGSTWSQTNSTVMMGGIILDPTGEFTGATLGTVSSICVN